MLFLRKLHPYFCCTVALHSFCLWRVAWQSTFSSLSKLPNWNNLTVTPYHCDGDVAGHGPGYIWAWALCFLLPAWLLCRASVLNAVASARSKANNGQVSAYICAVKPPGLAFLVSSSSRWFLMKTFPSLVVRDLLNGGGQNWISDLPHVLCCCHSTLLGALALLPLPILLPFSPSASVKSWFLAWRTVFLNEALRDKKAAKACYDEHISKIQGPSWICCLSYLHAAGSPVFLFRAILFIVREYFRSFMLSLAGACFPDLDQVARWGELSKLT